MDYDAKDKIILALDVDNKDQAIDLVSELKDYVGIYKIGKELFTSEGPAIVKSIINNGGKIFLDLKYHDIPNTVAKAASAATRLGVFMFDIHCAGGSDMMKAAVESSEKTALELNIKKPLIIGITVLTSMTEKILKEELNINRDLQDQVINFAKLAKQCCLDGVVASPHEIKAIRDACGEDFLIITPGVRPIWSQANDQKRIKTPKEAISDGADYLVIGRPITTAQDKVKAVKMILEEIS